MNESTGHQPMLAPIVLFVYNRVTHTRWVIESLLKCEGARHSKLFIYSDGAKHEADQESVAKVRTYLDSIRGFEQVSLTKRERNNGLAHNIIQGVTEVISRYGKVIVIEDDLIFSPHFLTFMNSALNYYEKDPRIFSISGYNPAMRFPSYYQEQVYLNYRNSSWGWATWSDRWDKIDWSVADFQQFMKDKAQQKLFNRGGEDLTDMLIKVMNGQVNSWSIRFTYAQYKQGAFTVYPVQSLVSNLGADGSGTHTDKTNKFDVVLNNHLDEIRFPSHLTVDENIMKEFKKFYRLSLKKKIKRMLLSVTQS